MAGAGVGPHLPKLGSRFCGILVSGCERGFWVLLCERIYWTGLGLGLGFEFREAMFL